jgi:hypothetical protein
MLTNPFRSLFTCGLSYESELPNELFNSFDKTSTLLVTKIIFGNCYISSATKGHQ